MLSGCQQRFGDLAVQMIGNHDADSIDIVGAHDGLPAAFGTFEAIAISGVVSEVGVDVGNRHQADRWRIGAEDRLGRAIGVCMGASGHARANDGNPNGISHDDQPPRFVVARRCLGAECNFASITRSWHHLQTMRSPSD
jgi:hypothetical protein